MKFSIIFGTVLTILKMTWYGWFRARALKSSYEDEVDDEGEGSGAAKDKMQNFDKMKKSFEKYRELVYNKTETAMVDVLKHCFNCDDLSEIEGRK